MMWGGKVSLERFRTAKTTEIAAIEGQKILFSGRLSIKVEGPEAKSNNGDTIAAKAHAEIGTIAHVSIIEVEDLTRPNPKECIGARVGCRLALNTLGQPCRSIPEST
jgi:hypothetical protein